MRRPSRKGRKAAPAPGAAAPVESASVPVVLSELDRRLRGLVRKAVTALLDRKAGKLVVLDLSHLSAVSDFFVLASASSARQAQALADAVERAMREEGRRPSSVEGYAAATWLLLDYGDIVFHLFHEEARRFYGLERLWGDAPDVSSDFAPAG